MKHYIKVKPNAGSTTHLKLDPKPIAVASFRTPEDLDSLEDRCLDMGEQVDP